MLFRSVVLPSYREGMPRAILEGVSMGKAVITTDAAGCRETVEEGQNGFLVPVKSVTELADSMQLFCDMSAEVLAEMGAKSRLKAVQEFDQAIINQTIVQIVEQTLAEKNTAHARVFKPAIE